MELSKFLASQGHCVTDFSSTVFKFGKHDREDEYWGTETRVYGSRSSIFSSPGQSPGRAIVLAPALALALASASALALASASALAKC